jgi:hypothetical protein
MRTSIGAAWIVAVVSAALLVANGASAEAGVKLNSFSGTCAFQGTASFSPPATNDQQSLRAVYEATGSCSGRLNGRQISNAPVRARNAAHAVDGSCLRADTTRPGRGRILFADGTSIVFSSEFHFVGTNGTFSVRGERSGSAHGVGSFLTPRTPPELAAQCAGAGVSRAPLDLTLTTDSPLVSRARSNEGGGTERHLRGTAGDDVLVGTEGNDVIACGAGHDRVDGRGGNDVVRCGSGHDVVAGGEGNDRLHGGSGDDRLSGGPGNDTLFGDSGDDRLEGGPGSDRSDGGPGDDSTDRPRTDPGRPGGSESFRGDCTFSGAVVFDPPLTNQPQAVTQRVRAPGTCSGTFVDRRGRSHDLSNAPTTFSESSRGNNASCASGGATGRGALSFRLGTIDFAFTETRVGGLVVGEAVGSGSGSARGLGGVSPSENPAAIAQRCAGAGLKKVKIDVELATTPVISG